MLHCANLPRSVPGLAQSVTPSTKSRFTATGTLVQLTGVLAAVTLSLLRYSEQGRVSACCHSCQAEETVCFVPSFSPR